MTFDEKCSNPILCKEMTLKWDIEYWQTYVYSYQTNLIENYSKEDYEECLLKLEEAINFHRKFINDNSEVFI